jgi:RNA polymerase sigma-70 factor (ECF subfamily)
MTILLHPTAYLAASDEQLVDLVREGDDRAFDAIHERYEQRLIGFARQMLGGGHHDAEEIVQDAFVRALAALRADRREQVMRADDLRHLVGELKRLPERQRTALVAHELGGASHETIARRLNVSVGGSKALVCRARAGLARARAA